MGCESEYMVQPKNGLSDEDHWQNRSLLLKWRSVFTVASGMVTTVGGLVNSGYTSGCLGHMLNGETVRCSPARSVL